MARDIFQYSFVLWGYLYISCQLTFVKMMVTKLNNEVGGQEYKSVPQGTSSRGQANRIEEK